MNSLDRFLYWNWRKRKHLGSDRMSIGQIRYVKIINKTKNTVVAEDAIVTDKFFKRLIGLLNGKSLNPGEGLIIKPCKWIHTFFMRFPVDVIFGDAENKVIAIKSCFKPWRISAIYWQAKFAIELPCGTIKRTFTTIGDIIELI